MKNLKLIALFLAFISFGCSKKGNGGEQTGQYFIKAKVEGALKECSAGIAGTKTTIDNLGVVISLNGRYGSDPAFGGFDLSISGFKGVGTYLMGPGTIDVYPAIALYRWDGKTPPENYIYSSGGKNCSGKMVVTSYANNIIKGTFEFTGRNNDGNTGETKTVTNGSFEVKLNILN
ncbi:MAG: hypothetical protein EOP53_21850 [Sphingobacteriales bacterium]|nr:MAG: hypothetical protein EOP53_21850 [Sphingobacteriales bacterium]